MIKHIVCWTLKGNAEGRTKAENAVVMKNLLEGIKGIVPGMIHYEVGLNFNVSDAAFDVALYSEFENRDALDAYQVHPEHLRVVKELGKIRDKRIIADYEI
ncbi:MAG: Dabb family protein [Lentimicrobiaceae bacterium]|nr:Dabb family protein [Lentimicrobiaceae bacterium]